MWDWQAAQACLPLADIEEARRVEAPPRGEECAVSPYRSACGQVQLVGALEVHPKVDRHAEILRQTQRRVGGHVPFAREDLVEPVVRHFDQFGEPFGGKAGFLQLISEDLSGVSGLLTKAVSFRFSMVVDNLDVQTSRRFARPIEATAATGS